MLIVTYYLKLTMNCLKYIALVAIMFLVFQSANASEIVEQPCQDDCPGSIWSPPLFYTVTEIGDTDPIKLKYRSRYNDCLERYEVFVDWIASTGPTSKASLATYWALDAQTMVVAVTVCLLADNPMNFPPTIVDDDPECIDYAIVAGHCFELVSGTGCPDQYISTCDVDQCYRRYAEVCLNMSDEREVSTVTYVPEPGGPSKPFVSGTCPSFSQQPMSVTTCASQSVSFSSAASSTTVTTMTFQWQQKLSGSWTDISGATSSTLTINSVLSEMNGSAYRVVAVNPCGHSISNVATLSVPASIAIVTQPADYSVEAGSDARFKVVLAGTSGAAYQWQIDTGGGWADISGATGSQLVVSSATLAMDGDMFRVQLSSECSSTSSTVAILTVQ